MTAPKIVVADDDRNLVDSLAIRLRASGFKVFATYDAYQALKIARDVQPDVMVLDINMPAGNGFSVQQRMQQSESLARIPIIYLTGERSSHVKRVAAQVGAFALVYKPYDAVDLVATILDAVGSSQTEPKERESCFTPA